MRDFTIDLIWTKIQIAVAALGGWLGYFLGEVDGLLIALVIFMALDYITGLMCAIMDKKLSSAVGFRGICKKVLILMLVAWRISWIFMSWARAPRCAARSLPSISPTRD